MVALRLATQPSSLIMPAGCSAGGVSKRLRRDSARTCRVRSLARLHRDDAQFRCVQPRQRNAKLARVRCDHCLHLTGGRRFALADLRRYGHGLHRRLRGRQLRAQRDRALLLFAECTLVLLELALNERGLLLRRAELGLEVWFAGCALELTTLLLAKRLAHCHAHSARIDTEAAPRT
ncbi:hypothetical protein T492DRAFT_980735, partial [Pavlovales sp. CCMP2436]